MSKRHDLVSKILKSSIIFAALFGATSVFYAVAEESLGESLEKESALSALRVTLAIDKLTLNQEIIKSEAKCSLQNAKDCGSYVKSLVKTKNRIRDYKILLTKTLGYSPQSDEASTLEKYRKEIDALTQARFGLSLSEARKKNIISIDQFIAHISQDQKPEKLIAKLILSSSDEEDLVFDPFLGSGTTAVVAKKLKRRYLGFYKDLEYCLYALKRLEKATTDSSIQGYNHEVFWERNSCN